MLNSIICGDCLDVMKNIPDNYIDLTVTSPPYDNLRTYNGFVFDFEGTAQELYRVTKPGGVVVWVVNDKVTNGSESGTSFRQALGFVQIGFNLHDTMIWYKTNPMPIKSNRYQPSFEYMFVLSKGKPNTFNPIKVPASYAGEKKLKKHRTFRQADGTVKEATGTSEIVRDSRIKHNVWNFTAGYMHSSKDKIAYNHPAIFPEKLAEDHILSWSNPGDTVLDPMCGSGTTCKMAVKTDRQYIGIDISEEYCNIARKRTSDN